jgi:murein DD-endopeptidase MepM/ murein hydrolase activator NlpD
MPGTRCYAIADGVIRYRDPFGDYGLMILLEFDYRGDKLYGAYAHLGGFVGISKGSRVSAGDWIGITGNSGNATSMQGEDQHLHFEIRDVLQPGKGLGGRKNPRDLYKTTPLQYPVFDGRNSGKSRSESEGLHPDSGAFGLRVSGVNS